MGSSGLTVLVVEDEALIRMDIVDNLQEAGFTVIEAAHADEALQILSTRSDIHLLFTDIDMPGTMDGLKLAAAVRDRWPPVKIIVTSGHRSHPGDTETPFFPKPYQAKSIVAAINALTKPS